MCNVLIALDILVNRYRYVVAIDANYILLYQQSQLLTYVNRYKYDIVENVDINQGKSTLIRNNVLMIMGFYFS